MSQGQPIPLAVAQPVAQELVGLLTDACDRIAIAGSIRRHKPTVSDIEIVAIPRFDTIPAGDLWGTDLSVDVLADRLAVLRSALLLLPRDVEVHRASGKVEVQQKLGSAYQALVFRHLPVDLFIVRDPDRWGTIFALRTGPGDWNTRIVTDCHKFLRRVEGGKVYRTGQLVPCPEEEDFFRAVGQPWVEPAERSIGRVRIGAQAAQVPA